MFYFHISPETLRASLNLERASAAVKLFRRFCVAWKSDDDTRRRFKAIGFLDNPDEIDLGGPLRRALRSYNGKPMLIFKSGQLFEGRGAKAEPKSGAPLYIEQTVHISKFSYTTKAAFHSMQSELCKMELSFGFVIQGNADAELPEALFGAAQWHRLGLQQTPELEEQG